MRINEKLSLYEFESNTISFLEPLVNISYRDYVLDRKVKSLSSLSSLEVSAQILFDDIDFSPDTRQFGVYLEDKLAGRFRVREINDNNDLEVSRFSLDKNVRFSPRSHLSLLYFMFAQSLAYDKVKVTCFLQDEPYYERLGGFVVERFLNDYFDISPKSSRIVWDEWQRKSMVSELKSRIR